ncbi:MAG: hypothetical protein V3V53_04040 [Bacteroidales bacterium]
MKRITFTILVLLFFVFTSKAQDYHTGLGLRASVSPGISVKHFFTTNMAGEGILTVRWGGFNATGLAEWHLSVFDTEGFYFFYGGGAHLGVWDSEKDYYGSTTGGTTLFLGVDGIIGLEYAFLDIPLSISLDWKPGMNIISDFGFFFDDLAISFRYLFR